MIDQFLSLPLTSNRDLKLDIPYQLSSLDEFYALPVPEHQLQARDLILQLQDAMLRLPRDKVIGPDVHQPVHRFTKGIYTRELTMPPGTIIVGKRHAKEHIVIMSKGRCTVFTERGQEDFDGPCTFISPAGEKRVLFVHEETTWITIHRTDATTLEEVEADCILSEQALHLLNSPETTGAIR